MTDPKISVLAALADRYEIEGEIGRGGMATVYRARDRRHGSQVAIKVLRQELIVALGGERFTREVMVTAGLQHPHILPLLDSGQADGLPYYVMPFVSGASLAQRIERGGPLPINEAVQYAAEIADGLAHAHSKGLIHRDIKPANILLSEGHALIADFGIARVLDTGAEALTDSGLALGTAAYMSPEQAAGERVDARADIYALGCVLYELLTGNPPFTGSSQRAIMARHAMDPVPSVRTVRPEVSRALEAVITKALAKTAGDRFASAAEFRSALLEAPAITQAQDALVARGARRSRWGVVAGVAAVAVAAAVFFAKQQGASGALSDHRVMVYPLVLPGDWTGSHTAGEDVSTMIGSVMDGAGALRWIDGWQQLPPARRDSMRLLSDDEANALARKHRCRYVLTGRLTRIGDSTAVSLSLLDLTYGSVTRKQGTGPASEPWRAGLRAVNEILPTLIPDAAAGALNDWNDRNPQAVALFLAGEAAFRRLHRDSALKLFKAAVDADSTFGYAALRGAQTASWAHRPGEAKALTRVAISHARSPREQAFAAGLDAFLDGRADSSVAALKAALTIDPEMTAAWTQLSETYLHLLPVKGSTDSLAYEALAQAVLLDSANPQLLFHRVELAARTGRRDSTLLFADRFLTAVTDTMLRGEVALMAACVDGRWSDSLLIDAATHRPQALSAATKLLGLSHPRCMHAGYAALLRVDTANTVAADGRRFFAIVGLHQALLARGETDAAMAAVDSFIARWKYGATIFLVDAPIVPAFAARARQVAAEDSARYGADFKGAPYTHRLWLHGVRLARDGKIQVAQAIAADLATRGGKKGQQRDSVRSESVLAHVALARGDTADAIRRLNSILQRPAPSDSVAWEDAGSLGLERLMLGRLLLERREFAEARAVLEVLDAAAPASFPLYAPTALKLRIEAANGLGDGAQADALRKRAVRVAP